jgi:hypothetical protein
MVQRIGIELKALAVDRTPRPIPITVATTPAADARY